MADGGLVTGLEFEVFDTLSLFLAPDFQGGRTDYGESLVGVDTEFDLAHAVLEGEEGDGNLDPLSHADGAGQGSLDHHRLGDVDILLAAALCLAVGGDDHGAE